jgi:hypothetical protein
MWPISLVLQREKHLYQYTPKSDFSIVVKGYPILLLEVSSAPTSEADMRRMQLQVACLVRLGNALTASGSTNFFLRAIYIDNVYQATEYTFYQRSHLNVFVAFSYSRMTETN